MTTPLPPASLQFFADLSVHVDKPQEVGRTAGARHPDKVVMRFWQLA